MTKMTISLICALGVLGSSCHQKQTRPAAEGSAVMTGGGAGSGSGDGAGAGAGAGGGSDDPLDFLEPFMMTSSEYLPCPSHASLDEVHRKINPCAGQISHDVAVLGPVSLSTNISDPLRDGGFGLGGWYASLDLLISELPNGSGFILNRGSGQRRLFTRDETAGAFKSTMLGSDHALKKLDSDQIQLTIAEATLTFTRVSEASFGLTSLIAGRRSMLLDRNAQGYVTAIRSAVEDSAAAEAVPNTDLFYEDDKVIRVVQGSNEALITYDAAGYISQISVSDVTGSYQIRIAHDPVTGMVAIINPSTGGLTKYSYFKMADGSYAVAQTVNENNYATKYQYSKNHMRITNLTSINDVVFDIKHRPVEVTTNGLVTKTVYNEEGQVVSVEDPFGRKRTYGYDVKNQLTRTHDLATDTVTSIQHDADGRVIGITQTRGERSTSRSFQRDSQGRVETETVNGVPSLTVTLYDTEGRPIKMDSPWGTETRAYDEKGRLVSMDSARLGLTTFSYLEGGERRVTNPFGLVSYHRQSENSTESRQPNGNTLRRTQNGNTTVREVEGPTGILRQFNAVMIDGDNQLQVEALSLNDQPLVGTQTRFSGGLHMGTTLHHYMEGVLREPKPAPPEGDGSGFFALTEQASTGGAFAVSTISEANCKCPAVRERDAGLSNQYDGPVQGSQ